MIGRIKNNVLRRLTLVLSIPFFTIAFLLVMIMMVIHNVAMALFRSVGEAVLAWCEICFEFKKSWLG